MSSGPNRNLKTGDALHRQLYILRLVLVLVLILVLLVLVPVAVAILVLVQVLVVEREIPTGEDHKKSRGPEN